MKHQFAHKEGIMLLFSMLLHQGDMCPKCWYATKKTSKRWAKCKKCGMRVERKDINNP